MVYPFSLAISAKSSIVGCFNVCLICLLRWFIILTLEAHPLSFAITADDFFSTAYSLAISQHKNRLSVDTLFCIKHSAGEYGEYARAQTYPVDNLIERVFSVVIDGVRVMTLSSYSN